MIRTEQKILFVKIICQASFDISVFRYRYQSIVDKINSQKLSKVQKNYKSNNFAYFSNVNKDFGENVDFLRKVESVVDNGTTPCLFPYKIIIGFQTFWWENHLKISPFSQSAIFSPNLGSFKHLPSMLQVRNETTFGLAFYSWAVLNLAKLNLISYCRTTRSTCHDSLRLTQSSIKAQENVKSA